MNNEIIRCPNCYSEVVTSDGMSSIIKCPACEKPFGYDNKKEAKANV